LITFSALNNKIPDTLKISLANYYRQISRKSTDKMLYASSLQD